VFLEYASKHLPKQICIFANLDIYFDETLELLWNPAIDLSYKNYYFLSRYEDQTFSDQAFEDEIPTDDSGSNDDFMQMREIVNPENGRVVIKHRSIGDQCGTNFIGSHDSIIFIPPLPLGVIPHCQFPVGSWGFENRLMWEFERVGIKARNPCLDIKSWHVHKSLLKTSWMPRVNEKNRSSVAHPQKLFPSPYLRMRIDLGKGILRKDLPFPTSENIHVMLRNEHSARCLFSRSDGKFGHARCNEDYVDQHFIIQELKGNPLGLIFVGRESGMCLTATHEWVGHTICDHLKGSRWGIEWHKIDKALLKKSLSC